MKRVGLFFIWLISIGYSYAQSIEGKVVDATTNTPIPFATVAIHSSDSLLITGGVTNVEGLFDIKLEAQSVSLSPYFISASCLGYKSAFIRVEQQFTTIALSPDEFLLDEIVVEGNRRFISMNPSGNLVAQVSGTALSKSISISDLLSSIPGLVRKGDQITTIHGASPLYVINGRKVRSMSEISKINVKDILTVEIDHNPGAEYEGKVSAVVFIKTIRPTDGLAVTMQTMVERSRAWSHEELLSTSYALGKFVLYASLEYNGNGKKSIQDISYRQVNALGSDEFYLRSLLRSDPSRFNLLSYSIGADYNVNDAHSLYVSWDGYRSVMKDIGIADNEVLDLLQNESHFKSTSHLSDRTDYGHLAANYNWSSEIGTKLTVAMDYATTQGQRYQTSVEQTGATSSEMVSQNHPSNRFFSVNPTLSVPFSQCLTLTLGGQFDHIYNINDLLYTTTSVSQKSSSTEFTVAAFAGLQFRKDKYRGQVGLRYEQNSYLYRPEKGDEVKETSPQILPYAAISFPLGQTFHQVSYKHFINRPRLGFMGGYSYYLNRYSKQEGNPLLRAESTNTFTYALMWRKFYLSANYQYIQNPITGLTTFSRDTNEGVGVFSWHNLKHRHNITVLLNYSNAFNWYDTSLSLAYIHHITPIESRRGFIEDLNRPVPFVQWQNAITLPWFNAHLDYQYTGKGYFGIFLTEPKHLIDVSMSKSWLDDRLTLSLYWHDLLKQNVDCYSSIYQGLRFTQREDQDRAKIGISIKYRFNKKKTQSIKSSEQLKRL